MARADSPKPSVASHVEEKTQAHLHDLREAQAASAAEHNTTFMQAMRENYKAVLWSAAISLTLVMEGYDLALMSNASLCSSCHCSVVADLTSFSDSHSSRERSADTTRRKPPGSSLEPGKLGCRMELTPASSSVASSMAGRVPSLDIDGRFRWHWCV